MTKALVMFSWWLDSLLAIKVLEKQWIDCTALTFITPFFGKEKASRQAKKFWIKSMIVDVSYPHFEVLQNPVYGYGKNLNPCIDCHGFMLLTAWKIADKQWYDIIASWEVLWQRPMSQNWQSLKNVCKLAGRNILRPLSAQLLEPTSYEEYWLVDRNQLLDIQWRWRTRQLELAAKYWLEDFEAPGGGCLLTEWGYTNKLKRLFEKFPKLILPIDAELIKHGRLEVFERWFVVMWRDEESNQKLIDLIPQDKENYKLFELDWPITWPISIIKIINISAKINSDLVNYYKQKVNKLKEAEEIKFKNT
jgi:hypothetical protein